MEDRRGVIRLREGVNETAGVEKCSDALVVLDGPGVVNGVGDLRVDAGGGFLCVRTLWRGVDRLGGDLELARGGDGRA